MRLALQQRCKDKPKDIVDTAVAAGNFKTLAAALKAADLVETLKGKGPFTVFAPTDEAFAKLPEGTVADLLKPENKAKLAGILTYHVVPGKVMAADVVKLSKAKTVQGSEVKIKVEDGKVMVDNANVVKTDIKCGNGVIHVIDAVILPKDIVDTAVAAGSFKTARCGVEGRRPCRNVEGEGSVHCLCADGRSVFKVAGGHCGGPAEAGEQGEAGGHPHLPRGGRKVMAADVVKLAKAKTVQGRR